MVVKKTWRHFFLLLLILLIHQTKFERIIILVTNIMSEFFNLYFFLCSLRIASHLILFHPIGSQLISTETSFSFFSLFFLFYVLRMFIRVVWVPSHELYNSLLRLKCCCWLLFRMRGQRDGMPRMMVVVVLVVMMMMPKETKLYDILEVNNEEK